jgi:phosphate transport system substrate-binding protein
MRRYRCVSAIAGLAVLFAAGCSRGPADAVVAAQIKARFFSDPLVKTSAVSVAVKRGEVVLGGTVTGVSVELQALKLAMETEGVRKVNDKISVVPPPEPPPVVAQATPAPRPRRSQIEPVAPPLAESLPEAPPRDQAQAAPVIARGPAPPPVPVRVTVVTPRLVAAPAPAEPEPGYAVPIPIPVPVFLNAAPAAEPRSTQSRAVALIAGGPRFLETLFNAWSLGFGKADLRARIQYQPNDSASQRTADFGVFDLPIDDRQLSRALDLRVLRFPVAVWGVVPICNVGGTLQTLNLSGEVLAAVYSGRILSWDDLAIRTLNPQAVMPTAPITVVHRSDPSDETWLFTEYLSAVSPEWKAQSGSAPSVNWPTGLGGAGNDGVLRRVSGAPNSIGYVDASFARQNGLRSCAVQNRAGRFVGASPASLTASAAVMPEATPPNPSPSIVNPPGLDAYPIASVMWLGVPTRLADPGKLNAMRSFLRWVLKQGQPGAATLGYGEPPKAVLADGLQQIARVQ